MKAMIFITLFLTQAGAWADGTSSGGGADGVIADNSIFEYLVEGNARVDMRPEALAVAVANVDCVEVDGLHYKNVCTAFDLHDRRRVLLFQANHFINYMKEVDASAIQRTIVKGSTHYTIDYLKCSKSLLPPQPEDLDEDGYYNETMSYSCTTKR